MRKAVIGLSGGLDSTTLLGTLLWQGFEVHCCIFNYGSKHNPYEINSAWDIIAYYQLEGYTVVGYTFDLRQAFTHITSDLLLSGGEIPEGHHEDASMQKTIVPGRNLIFASIMAGLAESIGAESISLGVHAGDHEIYPDCRPEFINSLNTTIKKSSDNAVIVTTPFILKYKAEIVFTGLISDTPFHLTRTCYKNQEIACGKCGACQERLGAFEKLNLKDPIKYE